MSASPGDLRAVRHLSRAISCVENRETGHEALLAAAYRSGRQAEVVGVTGPPGAGKSTLVDALGALWLDEGRRVAIVAVDPSSPFSGGAVLGDRVRMERSSGRPGLFLRSISARGASGGLSAAICDILAVLGEAGFERVLLETVGAGQGDLAVAEAADCVLVVGVPGLGDHVQASKAGMMEVGDVYAVNKADLPGAKATHADIEAALALAYAGEEGLNLSAGMALNAFSAQTQGRLALQRRHGDAARDASIWHPPVVSVSAASGNGVPALSRAIEGFLDWSRASERQRQRRGARLRSHVLQRLAERLLAPYENEGGAHAEALAQAVDAILAGKSDPGEAAAMLATRRAASRP